MEKTHKIHILSKNYFISDYLFSEQINQKFHIKYCEKPNESDILIIDLDIYNINELQKFINKPIIFFTYKIKPWIVHFLNEIENKGLIYANISSEDIEKTIRAAINGEVYYSQEIISMLFSRKSNRLVEQVNSLTSREIEIIGWMLKDFSNEKIAQQMHISIRTVNTHKTNIMKKIGAKTPFGMLKIVLDYSADFRKLF